MTSLCEGVMSACYGLMYGGLALVQVSRNSLGDYVGGLGHFSFLEMSVVTRGLSERHIDIHQRIIRKGFR